MRAAGLPRVRTLVYRHVFTVYAGTYHSPGCCDARGEAEASTGLKPGLTAHHLISASYGPYSAEHTTWIVVIVAPLTAFASGLAAKAGADTWNALKGFVARIYEERRKLGNQHGTIELDEGHGRIGLNDSLPDEAYEALAELDEEGLYFWTISQRAWRKP